MNKQVQKNTEYGMWNMGNTNTHNRKHSAYFLHSTFHIPHSARGFTLFYALIIVALLVSLGLAIFNITYKELLLSSGVRDSAQAFYAADTGIECAFFWDLEHTGLSSPAFGFYGDSLASGLAGYWRFDDGSGSETARDWSGRGNNGVLTNMDENFAWIGGRIGSGALEFDGVDDFVEAPNAPVTGSNPRTVTAWVYPYETLESRSAHLVEWGQGGMGRRYTVKLDPGNLLRVEVNGGFYISSLSVPQGQWSMIAVVFDGTTVADHTFYVNSSIDNGATGSTAIDTGSGNGVHIGDTFMTESGINDRKFFGAMDDVRVYNRALSTSEIKAIYDEASNIIFTDPIEANTPGVTCGGVEITDPSVSNWNVVTNTNAARTTFDLELSDGRCIALEVDKNMSTTTVISRGYSSCNIDDPRRVERAIRAEY